MQRRKFLQLGAAMAASVPLSSLSAKVLSGDAQGIYDANLGLSANKFGAFWVKSIGARVVDTEPFEGDAMPTVLNNALIDHI